MTKINWCKREQEQKQPHRAMLLGLALKYYKFYVNHKSIKNQKPDAHYTCTLWVCILIIKFYTMFQILGLDIDELWIEYKIGFSPSSIEVISCSSIDVISSPDNIQSDSKVT